MIRAPPSVTRPDTHFPHTTLFRSEGVLKHDLGGAAKIAFLPPVHRRDIDAIEADHAPREFLQPECGAAERRLARTAGADERDDLAAAPRDIDAVDHAFRSEERRVGKGGVSTCRSGW